MDHLSEIPDLFAELKTSLLQAEDGTTNRPDLRDYKVSIGPAQVILYYRVSHSFDDCPDDEVEVEAEQCGLMQDIVARLAADWGRPVFEGPSYPNSTAEPAVVEEYLWWSGDTPVAYWHDGDLVPYVTVEHFDKELPFMLILGILRWPDVLSA